MRKLGKKLTEEEKEGRNGMVEELELPVKG